MLQVISLIRAIAVVLKRLRKVRTHALPVEGYISVCTTVRATHTGLACESRYDGRVVAAERPGKPEINDSIEQNPAYGIRLF